MISGEATSGRGENKAETFNEQIEPSGNKLST